MWSVSESERHSVLDLDLQPHAKDVIAEDTWPLMEECGRGSLGLGLGTGRCSG